MSAPTTRGRWARRIDFHARWVPGLIVIAIIVGSTTHHGGISGAPAAAARNGSSYGKVVFGATPAPIPVTPAPAPIKVTPVYVSPSRRHAVRVARQMGADSYVTVRCVPQSSLVDRPGWIVYGVTDPTGMVVRLSKTLVCDQLDRYLASGYLSHDALRALSTVAHEVAHTNGTVYEATAECQGITATLHYLARHHAGPAEVADARSYLVDGLDGLRPAQYRLANVGCRA